MKPPWTEITLQVPAAGVDLVSYVLTDQGAAGVVTAVHKLDTFIPPAPDQPDIGDQTLHGYFPAVDNSEELCVRLRAALVDVAPLIPGLNPGDLLVRQVAEDDWAENWKQHFKPFRVGPLLIRPTWEQEQPAADETLLQIDPGMAFGTGSHATTRLCLEALVAIFSRKPPRRVLDVGTGSGILAIAAALLGAGHVVGCDIEEEACRVAKANAVLNRVEERLDLNLTPLEKIPGRFDLVLANILAEENVRLSAPLRRHLADEGSLVLSGILEEKVPLVREAFDPLFNRPAQLLLQEEWACLVYRG
ncbi:50S ribosomal protein L11 methyltransferase [Geothermobacter hydrogeniphilus]|uniref:Ribosomal protein L11 methyltransferase n=1 Tax=Geothermobacter hydrogeniphilus TaxID=1969733 RepID=A0A1X0Y7T8_9BACT|nr:50S ribosomal protein L11 methyltransferase [Geothermobacter hydrogeniphilus]ORJ61271.1 ribosomal protein L11 methyltransferase [Geothermobacter hydrogeniphilus]